MKKFLLLFVGIFVLLSFSYVYSQSTTIEDIRNQPGKFEGANVTVIGLVTQYVHGTGPTSYYIIKGDYGGTIKVNTAESAPETNKKYQVTGIVYIDKEKNIPFISEKSKILFENINQTPPAKEPEKPVVSEEAVEKPANNTTIFFIIVAIILLLALALWLALKQKKSAPDSVQPIVKEQIYSSPVEEQIKNEPAPVYSSDSEYKTIKIVTSSPKTLVFIPGKLTIISGEDKGKSFRIAAYPTTEGNIVTIGREEVKGDRAYAHIQLHQKTVSRKQAEIIYQDGKLYIKNLSETNYTQLDGVELKPNEKALLKNGAVIRLGELEIKYEV